MVLVKLIQLIIDVLNQRYATHHKTIDSCIETTIHCFIGQVK